MISTAEASIIRELHIVKAHHLHYISLLEHFAKHINFIRNTPNPAMEGVCEVHRQKSFRHLAGECDHLLNAINRLNNELGTQKRQLDNVMDLVSYITSVCRIYFLILAIDIK